MSPFSYYWLVSCECCLSVETDEFLTGRSEYYGNLSIIRIFTTFEGDRIGYGLRSAVTNLALQTLPGVFMIATNARL